MLNRNLYCNLLKMNCVIEIIEFLKMISTYRIVLEKYNFMSNHNKLIFRKNRGYDQRW